MKLIKVTDLNFEENCYILTEGSDAYIIDPGFSFDKINQYLKENSLNLKYIFLTHAHIDHTGEMDKIQKYYKNVIIYVSEEDSSLLFDDSLNCSRMFGKPKTYSPNPNIVPYNFDKEIDGFKFHKAPGHTKGSILIEYKDFLFTGDTLFKESVGRTDFPTGDMNELEESLKYIKKCFSKKTIILPGHYQKTTVGDELKNNQYLRKR